MSDPVEPRQSGGPTNPQSTLPGTAAGPPSAAGRRRSRRRALAIVGIALVLGVGAAGFAAGQLGPEPPPATPSGASPSDAASSSPATMAPLARDGFLVGPTDLADRIRRGRAGDEPYATAMSDLLEWAHVAVTRSPAPQKSLDIPDTEGPFVDDTAAAYGLALAWVATGERRFADAAADHIRAWVTTTTETVNTCPTGGECQTSLIIGRVGAGFVFAADLIADSGSLTAADESAFRAWLRDVLLSAASERPNNWGDAGNLMRLAVADYLDDGAMVTETLASWRSFMDLVDADGHIPEEVRRGTSGMQYTQEALMYKVAAARIAERRGVDLWSYRGSGGADLRLAIDHLARYWDDPAAWPWNQRAPRVPAPAPMWEIAYEHYGEPAWPALFLEGRPFGSSGHSAIRWTTLTNGLPTPGQ